MEMFIKRNLEFPFLFMKSFIISLEPFGAAPDEAPAQTVCLLARLHWLAPTSVGYSLWAFTGVLAILLPPLMRAW